jgi:dipeptidyl aminopeptidase/acylaminoacyl peptidase
VWFSSAEDARLRASIHALGIDGPERIVHRTMGSVRIADIARDGRALLLHEEHRSEMSFVDSAAPGERDLTLRNWSRPRFLSSDGTSLLFIEGSFGNESGAFFRRTDGAPAVQLGKGDPVALSPDGAWALLGSPGGRLQLTPTGPGNPRELERGTITGGSSFASWLPDGRRIVFVAREAGRPPRVFVQDVRGGAPEPLTPEGVRGPIAVSPDSKVVLAFDNGEQTVRAYPLDRSASSRLMGAIAADEALAWTPDGQSVWVLNRTPPAKIFRIDVRRGERTFFRDAPLPDPGGTDVDSLRLYMSADGKRLVYSYQKHLSTLYVATGLK